MSTFYTTEQRALQERFEIAKMADLVHHVIVHSEVQEAERAFIKSRDMFFLARVGSASTWCSPPCPRGMQARPTKRSAGEA
jgi:hypothetical protein